MILNKKKNNILLSMHMFLNWRMPRSHFEICDVISEKVPYGGKNIIGPDQTPRMMRGV